MAVLASCDAPCLELLPYSPSEVTTHYSLNGALALGRTPSRLKVSKDGNCGGRPYDDSFYMST